MLSGVSVAINSGAMARTFSIASSISSPFYRNRRILLPYRSTPGFIAAECFVSLQRIATGASVVNLEVPFGKTVAILGPNGSGKSTLIQLLCRYYDPVEGCIAFDGVDLRSMAIEDNRNTDRLVSQSTELFNRTVARTSFTGI